MKKILFLTGALFFGTISLTKAQCYGTIHLDDTTNANGASTFTINTANPNELILIAYNGWPGPGSGPVTVDGNPATHIITADTANSSTAEIYAYSAPAAGSHTIVCTETGYSSPYYLNFAASFYVTGSCAPLSVDSLVPVAAYRCGLPGDTLTASLTTITPNEVIFSNMVANTGGAAGYGMIPTGMTKLDSLREGSGIDAVDGYTNAPTPGTYSVSVTDTYVSPSYPEYAMVLVGIVPPPCSGYMTLASSDTNLNCNADSNGSASVTPSGGTGPYTYSWAPSGGTMSSATGLKAGSYTVTVTDNNGCTLTDTITITQPTAIMLTDTVTSDTGNCNGWAEVMASGGTGPYTYSWNGGGTNDTISGKCAGTYTCTVTDSNGCSDVISVTILSTAGIQNISSVNKINVYPDPNNGIFMISGIKKNEVVELYNYMGQKLSSTKVDNSSAMQFNIADKADGVYVLKITNSGGKVIAEKQILKQ